MFSRRPNAAQVTLFDDADAVISEDIDVVLDAAGTAGTIPGITLTDVGDFRFAFEITEGTDTYSDNKTVLALSALKPLDVVSLLPDSVDAGEAADYRVVFNRRPDSAKVTVLADAATQIYRDVDVVLDATGDAGTIPDITLPKAGLYKFVFDVIEGTDNFTSSKNVTVQSITPVPVPPVTPPVTPPEPPVTPPVTPPEPPVTPPVVPPATPPEPPVTPPEPPVAPPEPPVDVPEPEPIPEDLRVVLLAPENAQAGVSNTYVVTYSRSCASAAVSVRKKGARDFLFSGVGVRIDGGIYGTLLQNLMFADSGDYEFLFEMSDENGNRYKDVATVTVLVNTNNAFKQFAFPEPPYPLDEPVSIRAEFLDAPAAVSMKVQGENGLYFFPAASPADDSKRTWEGKFSPWKKGYYLTILDYSDSRGRTKTEFYILYAGGSSEDSEGSNGGSGGCNAFGGGLFLLTLIPLLAASKKD
jgi:hypothetical protein